jgi:protein FAM32A
MSFTGGKLTFKGGVVPAVRKKKKKGKKAKNVEGSGGEDLLPIVDKEQSPADPAVQEDTRTEAEKRRDAHMAKYEKERAKKAASKSHREKIQEMNKYLEGLSEHHDIPKTSYSYM